jgi:creatinine amidohydrolase
MESLHVMRLRGAERERAAALPFAVLAVGSIEYHGAHGPFGTDTMVADGFAERLAERRPCLVFPPVAYTFVPRLTRRFGPAASVAPEPFLAYLTEVLRGVLALGPRRLLVINGHSENQHALRLAAEVACEDDPRASVVIANWWKFIAEPSAGAPPNGGGAPAGWAEADGFGHGHGGPLEMSVAAAVDARGVERPAGEAADVPYEAPWWRAAAQVVGRGQAPAGFAGYHGRISAIDLDRGRSLVDEVTDGLVRLVDDWVARVDAVGSEDGPD